MEASFWTRDYPLVFFYHVAFGGAVPRDPKFFIDKGLGNFIFGR